MGENRDTDIRTAALVLSDRPSAGYCGPEKAHGDLWGELWSSFSVGPYSAAGTSHWKEPYVYLVQRVQSAEEKTDPDRGGGLPHSLREMPAELVGQGPLTARLNAALASYGLPPILAFFFPV